MMKALATFGRQAFATLLCLSLIVWSVLPAATHAPAVLETIEDHLQVIVVHGHSHGFAEDLAWVLHGHSHDSADHDHNQPFLATDSGSDAASIERSSWRLWVSLGGPAQSFRIDRPPRA